MDIAWYLLLLLLIPPNSDLHFSKFYLMCVYVYMQGHMSVLAGTRMFLQACVARGGVPQELSSLCFEPAFLIGLELTRRWGWMAMMNLKDLPISASSALGFQLWAPMPGLSCGGWHGNSGPHVCTAGTLSAKLSPLPWTALSTCYVCFPSGLF